MLKKIIPLLLLTPLLFLTGCGALRSIGAGGDKPTQPIYKNYVRVDSSQNGWNGEDLEYEYEGINKKWGVSLSSIPDFTATSVSDGLKTTTTFIANDIGVPGSFKVNFVYEKRSSKVATSKSQTRTGSESTTYLGGSNTNYEGQFRILESDYRLGIHIPQEENNGVVVSVIGQGVVMNHEAFRDDAFWQNSGENCSNEEDDDGNGYADDCYGYDFAQNKGFSLTTTQEMIIDSHETQVAGIITGESVKNGYRSINPKSQIMNLKVVRDSDRKHLVSAVEKSIRYSADNIDGKCILNMSFTIIDLGTLIKDSLEYAYGKGCLIFAGVGNSGDRSTFSPHYYSDYVEGITGLDPNGTERYSGSSWSDSVMFASPVIKVYSLAGSDGYYAETGTSYSTPIISGIASLIWGNDPNLSRQDVLDKLIYHSEKIPEFDRTGKGKIKVRKLVESYVELHFKTVQSDIDNDGQLEQLNLEISTNDGEFNKGYITHIVDDGVQYSVFREI